MKYGPGGSVTNYVQIYETKNKKKIKKFFLGFEIVMWVPNLCD